MCGDGRADCKSRCSVWPYTRILRNKGFTTSQKKNVARLRASVESPVFNVESLSNKRDILKKNHNDAEFLISAAEKEKPYFLGKTVS